jgi:hypothetical protein
MAEKLSNSNTFQKAYPHIRGGDRSANLRKNWYASYKFAEKLSNGRFCLIWILDQAELLLQFFSSNASLRMPDPGSPDTVVQCWADRNAVWTPR